MSPLTTPPGITRRSSELSKRPAEVFAEAERAPVTITRRDGESLILMSRREAGNRDRLLELAAQLITASLDDDPLPASMTKLFPWMLALPPADRDACARELLDAARASFATEQAHLAIATLTAWEETASAMAAGLGNTEITWRDDEKPVRRP